MLENSAYGPSRRRRGSGSMLTHTLMAMVGAALATGLLLAFYNPTSGGSGISLPGSGAAPAPGARSAPLSGGEQAIVTNIEPGLVIINTTLQYASEAAAGTGMVINADGLVLTNNHVINGSTTITATVGSTGKTYRATVVGYDKTRDIALIQLQNASGLTTVPIGNSSSVQVGSAVVAMGNAEGRGTITAKPGQVTALNQTITASDDEGRRFGDAARDVPDQRRHQPGDSGGPLVSTAGVIGIDTAVDDVRLPALVARVRYPDQHGALGCPADRRRYASSTVTIGYSSRASSSALDLTAARRRRHSRRSSRTAGIGSNGSPPKCYTRNSNLTVPSTIAPVNSGALIIGTICGSPAASAGMTGGAVITAVNGQAVGSPQDLTGMLSRFHPGDTISVTWVSPSGQRTTSSLHLTAGAAQ